MFLLTLSISVISCGFCKDKQPCSATDGTCEACEPGWNGTQCDRPCPPGYYGDGCQMKCPRCRNNEPCDPRTGQCGSCDPGWTGPRFGCMLGRLILQLSVKVTGSFLRFGTFSKCSCVLRSPNFSSVIELTYHMSWSRNFQINYIEV